MNYLDNLKAMWFNIGSHAIKYQSITQTANLFHDDLGLNQDPLGRGKNYDFADISMIVIDLKLAIVNGALETDDMPYLQNYDPRGDILMGML